MTINDWSAILDSGILSGLNYRGTWDANANTPTLGNNGDGGEQGDYFIIDPAGNTSIDGETDWELRDWIMNNGDKWQKVDHSPVGDVGLDDAYDKGGSGLGRQINVVSGLPVVLQGDGGGGGSGILTIDGMTNPITGNTDGMIRLVGFTNAAFSNLVQGVYAAVGALSDPGGSGVYEAIHAETYMGATCQGDYTGVYVKNSGDILTNEIVRGISVNMTDNLNHGNAKYVGILLNIEGPTVTNFEYFYGIHIEMPDDDTPQDNPVHGIHVDMPSTMSGSDMCAFYGIAYATQIAKLCTGPPTYTAAEFTGRVRITDDGWGYGGLYINRADGYAIEIVTNGHASARAIKMVLDEGMGIEVDWTTNPITTDSRVMDIDMDITARGDYINVYGIHINIDEIGVGGINPTINGMYVEYTGYATSPAAFSGYEININGSPNSAKGFYVTIQTIAGSSHGFHAKFTNTSTAGAEFKGVYVEGDSATLTDFTVGYGVHVKMPDDPTPQNNPIYGIFVEMPASYTGSDMMGAKFTGDGKTVEIANINDGISIAHVKNQTVASTYIGQQIVATHTMNSASANFKGVEVDLDSVTLTSFNEFYGIHITMPGSAQSKPLHGLDINMTGIPLNTGHMAAKMAGGGHVVQIIDDANLLRLITAPSYSDIMILIDNSTTPTTSGDKELLQWYVDANNGANLGDLTGITMGWWETSASTVSGTWRGYYIYMNVLAGNNKSMQGMLMELYGERTTGKEDYGLRINIDTEYNHASADFTGLWINVTSTMTSYQFAYGIHVVMPDDATPTDNPLYGIYVEMDATYNGTDMVGMKVEGDGRTMKVTTIDEAIKIEISKDLNTAKAEYGVRIIGSQSINNSSAQFMGQYIDIDSVSLVDYQVVYGLQIDMPDDNLSVNNPLYGIYVNMPGAYTGTTMMGCKITGDGRTVVVCDTTYALKVTDNIAIVDIGGTNLTTLKMNGIDIEITNATALGDMIFSSVVEIRHNINAVVREILTGSSFTLQKAASAQNVYVDTYSTTSEHRSVLALRRSRDNTLGTLADTVNGNWIGGVEFWGVRGQAAEWGLGAKIEAIQVGVATGAKVPCKVEFTTSSETTTQVVATLREDGMHSFTFGEIQSVIRVDDANHAVGFADYYIAVHSLNVNDRTVTIAAAQEVDGRILEIKLEGVASGQKVIISPNSNIEGAATLDLTNDNESVSIRYDGVQWQIIS